MSATTNLGLPYLAANQAQKHVTLNESLRMLDAIVQLSVVSRSETVPPVSPAEGERHVVATSATGEWLGRDGEVAAFQDGGWMYYAPAAGWTAWVVDEDLLAAFDGTAWVDVGGNLDSLPMLGINAVADGTNRLAVSAIATLLNHAGNGHQLKVNKAASADTASLMLQNAFVGHAEIGLAGNNDLTVKTSADGSSWINAIVARSDTAKVGIGTASPQERLHVAGNLRIQDSAAFIGFYNSAGTTRTGYFQAHATAGFYFAMEQNLPMHFYTNNALRLTVTEGGDLGVGTATPTARLHVAGAMRVGSYNTGGLPSASGAGAGAIIHVANESGGAVLAFSDGTNWRRVTDRAVVS